MRFEVDIDGWIDGLLSDSLLRGLSWVSIVFGIGLVFWGVATFKKSDENFWNIVAILVGGAVLGRNLFDLFVR